jgi:hypothetical protein
MLQHERPGPPNTGDERATLLGFLRFLRATFEWKCDGLSADEFARRSVEPSEMSLLGLLRHLAFVEQVWFRERMSGLDVDRRYRTAEGDVAFSGATADPTLVEEAWAAWREEIAFADAFIQNAPSLEVTCQTDFGELSLRWVMTHMIEEYGRHCGHADLLRERIDGAVGE